MEILLQDPYSKGAIAKIYAKNGLVHKLTHEKAGRMTYCTDNGGTMAVSTRTDSQNVRHGLLQFNILHRLHWSKQKVHKIYPQTDPSCDRCGLVAALLGHMFWTCPRLATYWNINQTLTQAIPAWPTDGCSRNYNLICLSSCLNANTQLET